MTSRVMLFPSSSSHVDLYPEWDIKRETTKFESVHRTRSSKRTVYKWSEFDRWVLSLKDVTSSDASLINGWWSSNTELQFTTDSGTTVSSVQLVNKKMPLGSYTEPYDDLYEGKIELEGINGV